MKPREENEIDKFFRAKDRYDDCRDRGKAEETSFIDVWNDKWAGNVRNKATGTAAGGVAGAPKGAGAATATKKPTTSLFA